MTLRLFSIILIALSIFVGMQLVSAGASKPKLSSESIKPLTTQVDLKSGELLYVDFWASWCVPCRKSFPWMNSLMEKYKDKGIKIVAVNLDKEKELATEFLQRFPANFPIYFDPEGKFANEFQVEAMPSSYLLDDKGTVLLTHRGFKKRAIPEYEAKIEKALKANQQ